ncbi:MAG: hypothetical protein JWN62_4750, partial [Acidimicrobiales bacterium]|nr:hypothetical protein [Acidimicrobiales bacterium]
IGEVGLVSGVEEGHADDSTNRSRSDRAAFGYVSVNATVAS